MIKLVEITVSPESVSNDVQHRKLLANALGVSEVDITAATLVRRSIDARKRSVVYRLRYAVTMEEAPLVESGFQPRFQNVSAAPPVVIVGAGPAGMFAALKLIELGLKPVIFERGKDVRARRRDIAEINRQGIVNPESNYCFGEGGAGTFSDGKLYTRSHKRGSIVGILDAFVYFGASPDIRIDAHPHIGTNKLPHIIQTMREAVVHHGGEVHFNSRVSSFLKNSQGISGVELSCGRTFEARVVILATGHSARDIFDALQHSHISIEQKPFALGVRVEHPQAVIDEFQYHSQTRSEFLPAASYSLVAQCESRGVFSFCMCPGGIICPAATKNDEIVVNGWSPSKRNSYFANSGIVVELKNEDIKDLAHFGELAGVKFQAHLEQKSFELGGGAQVAPAQRLTDFLANKTSSTLPRCSYLPGIKSVSLKELFPDFLHTRLQAGFREFGKKRPAYITEEAVVVAVESRTSSPVRIPRDRITFMHPQTPGLFPVGEGAGYAGGIMSAAIDGTNAAVAVKQSGLVR